MSDCASCGSPVSTFVSNAKFCNSCAHDIAEDSEEEMRYAFEAGVVRGLRDAAHLAVQNGAREVANTLRIIAHDKRRSNDKQRKKYAAK